MDEHYKKRVKEIGVLTSGIWLVNLPATGPGILCSLSEIGAMYTRYMNQPRAESNSRRATNGSSNRREKREENMAERQEI